MEVLIRFLQNNRLIILVMFIITLLGGLMSIILGWEKFYDDFLSKSITLPVYMYLIILFVVVALSIRFWPATKDQPKGLQTIKGEVFGVQRILVDGKHFVNCSFRKTELAYRGEGDCRMDNCSLENIGFTFDGPAAATVKTLTGMYAVPELRPLIENTFKNIREGNLPIATPPSGAVDN